MRADVLLDLMSMVDACSADEGAKAGFRKMIQNVALANGVGVFERNEERAERVKFARHLLADLGEPKSIIRERLMARFQVCRSQAYADIIEAEQGVQ